MTILSLHYGAHPYNYVYSAVKISKLYQNCFLCNGLL